MNQSDNERMGISLKLAMGLAKLDRDGLLHRTSLPSYLLLAYVSEHFNVGSVKDIYLKWGDIFAAFGAVCEIGGIIGRITDVDPIEILARTMDVRTISPSADPFRDRVPTDPIKILTRTMDGAEAFWHRATLATASMLESYTKGFGVDPPGLLPLHVAMTYRHSGIDYPNDIVAIQRLHDLKVSFWDERKRLGVQAEVAFALGIALVRHHGQLLDRKRSVSRDKAPDLNTLTNKNPQHETNLTVGSVFSYQEQIALCKQWSQICRPTARPIFDAFT